jgi:cell division protein FtsL
MQEISQKNKTIIIFVVLLLFAVSLSWKIISVWGKHDSVQQEIQTLENEVAESKQANEKIADSIKKLDALSTKEKIAKEDLDLKRTGEIVLRFDPETSKKEAGAPQETEEKSKIRQWWDYFFGN